MRPADEIKRSVKDAKVIIDPAVDGTVTVSKKTAERFGPLIEVDERFPNKTNVQFLRVLNDSNIQIEIWERGAGYTLASGSSSTACACVAKRLGLVAQRLDDPVYVRMPGGTIKIEFEETETIADSTSCRFNEFRPIMSGTVTRVCQGTIDTKEMFTA